MPINEFLDLPRQVREFHLDAQAEDERAMSRQMQG